MNDIEIAVKYGAQHTVDVLIEEFNETGPYGCINLLMLMDKLLKSGEYDTLVEKVNTV